MRDVPFDGWMLSPSLVPKHFRIVRQFRGIGGDEWYASLKKSYIDPRLLFNTPQEAFAAADVAIAKQESDLTARRTKLDKRIAAVAKARAKFEEPK